MTDVLAKSVTRDDQGDYRNGGGVLRIFANPWPSATVGLPPALGMGWSMSGDAILRSTLYHEAMWAGAVSTAISKIAAQGFMVNDADDSKRRTSQGQELLLHADGGKGWVPFIYKQLRSFLLTRNGQFGEIVHATKAYGSKVLGLVHLSPFQCTRTGDPDYPVLYTDRMGRIHPLRAHQVYELADMPDDDEHLLGVGFPAALRAYPTIYKLSVLERYVSEKLAGNRALALHFIEGLSATQLRTALQTAEAEQQAKGAMSYKGAIVIPVMGEKGISIASINLAEIPDGFDAKTERDNAYQIYARALGIPLQDIQPLSGQGLGTGTQTMILDEAADGQGLAAWRKWFEQIINDRVLPKSTTFTFSSNDIRDQKAKAEVAKIRQETRSAMIESGMITTKQALNMALDADDVPPEFLPGDATAAGQLTDNEKPVEPGSTSSQPGQPVVAPAFRAAVQRAIAMKAAPEEEPEPYAEILDQTKQRVADVISRLRQGTGGVARWERGMLYALEQGHREAMLQGAGLAELDDWAERMVKDAVEEQRAYLRAFADEMRQTNLDGAGWQPRWDSRAAMYAESVKASYWRGATRGYALPAVPGDGTTQCLTECGCKWRIVTLDGEGNIDAYWQRATRDSCQTCIERAAEWAPFSIRDGEVVL